MTDMVGKITKNRRINMNKSGRKGTRMKQKKVLKM